MSQKFAAVKGMNDLLPPTTELWQRTELVARGVLGRFGYREIRTPILEDTALFVRSVGEDTDIVGKEMYTFEDKGGRSVSMRPEGTAPAVRAYIENAVFNQEPLTRWYYLGPMFRYERMKTGRYRQFWQVGAEAFGVKEPAMDVEVMELAVRLLGEVKGVTLRVNSLGDDACRPAYKEKLLAYFEGHLDALCEDCKVRLRRNPIRILDCKNPKCQEIARRAPVMVDALCQPCREHLAGVLEGLKRVGVPFESDPWIVRGLDYYTRTAFELVADNPVLGTATAVGGGGRYDKLVKELGGPDVPAIGFAIGLERLLMLQDQKVASAPVAFLLSADEAAQAEVMTLASQLRRAGLWVETDPRGGSLKSQMKRADKSGARYAIVLGERERAEQAVELKPLQGGDVRKVPLAELQQSLARPA